MCGPQLAQVGNTDPVILLAELNHRSILPQPSLAFNGRGRNFPPHHLEHAYSAMQRGILNEARVANMNFDCVRINRANASEGDVVIVGRERTRGDGRVQYQER